MEDEEDKLEKSASRLIYIIETLHRFKDNQSLRHKYHLSASELFIKLINHTHGQSFLLPPLFYHLKHIFSSLNVEI